MQFTHQVDIWIHFTHNLFIRSLCVLCLLIIWEYQEGNGNEVIRNVTGNCPDKINNWWHSICIHLGEQGGETASSGTLGER